MFRGARTARSNLYLRPNALAAFNKITARDVTPAFYLTVVPVPGFEPRAAPAMVPIVADVISARAIPGDDGTVAGGFVHTELDPESVSGLSDRPPLPSDCRF